MKRTIDWRHSKENTLEGYLGDTMHFDINYENDGWAVYQKKKPWTMALNRPAFPTLDEAQDYCERIKPIE